MACRNVLVLAFLALIASFWASAAYGADSPPSAEATPPFTLLFDTTAPSVDPLLPDALITKKGWSALPEDTLSHTFTGDAVVMNDRVAVVLRHNANGAELYSRGLGLPHLRASLVALGKDGSDGELASVKIIENTQAAVMVEAAFTAKSGAVAAFRFRCTAGESLVDVRGAAGAGKIRVCDQSQYVVAPDFFADDVVFDPSADDASLGTGARVGLPAENSVLGLSDNGNSIVACVWRSPRQNVDLLLSGEKSARKIAGYEIELPPETRLWIAVMEGARNLARAPDDGSEIPDADHAKLETADAGTLAGRLFSLGDGAGQSTSFADSDAGASTENVRSDGSCRLNAGVATVQTPGLPAASPRLMVVYPIERTRATPLTAFCLVDIMRNALGVGPCQYVLDAEGLRAGDNPTPPQVTSWVEKQFEKKVSKRDVDGIREQLSRMALQVKQTDSRRDRYAAFSRQVKQACADYAKTPENSAVAGRLSAIADVMNAARAPTAPAMEKLAADVAAQAESSDALAKTQPAIAAIRAASTRQEYDMARLRMAARRLKQACRTLAANDLKAAAFAGEIQRQAEEMLGEKK